MPLQPDYHMHTPLCRHARGEPKEYAAHALKLGLTEIGFSDHSPMAQDNFDDWRMAASELGAYVDSVLEAQRAYPSLTIRLGLEVDYIPGQEAWVRELSRRYEWDYFIGSVHYLSGPGRGWALDSPFELDEWKKRPVFEVCQEYFARLAQAAKSGLFDIIGHADLVKKFGNVPKEDCTPLYDRFLEVAADAGVVVELNTAGLRKDCREIYPGLDFLQRARKKGVPITFGSDAHAPEEVGMNFGEARAWATAAGYTRQSLFSKRKRQDILLS